MGALSRVLGLSLTHMNDLSTKSVTRRVRFRLAGPSRPFDPKFQAIRPDLADVAEAEHHFAPHYAAAAPFTAMAPFMLYASDDAGAEILGEIPEGAGFGLIDVTGGWGWGYTEDGHRVGYVDAALLQPATRETKA